MKKRRSKKQSTLGIKLTGPGGVARDIIPIFMGALICKFAAKRFVKGGGEKEDWGWKNYGLGLAATVIAGLLSSAVFRGRGSIATSIIKGGLLLFLYKLFVNEVAPQSKWLESWFGADEDIYPDMSEDLDIEEDDIYTDGTSDVVYGADVRYRPVNEMHRQPPLVAPASAEMGVTIEPADPTFGVETVPADPTFGKVTSLRDRYKRAYSN